MEQEPVNEGNLRFLRILITVLTITMIGGVIAMVGIFVIRLPSAGSMVLPDAVQLPDGVAADAVTFGPDWIAVVSGNQILVFDRASGDLRQTVDLTP